MIDRGPEFPAEATSAKSCPPEFCSRDVHGLREQVHEILGRRLEDVERRIQSTTRSRYTEVDQLSAKAAAMGGKRLRPMLVLLAAEVCRDAQTPASDGVVNRQNRELDAIATSVELVHAASLVHDDIMDDAEERRHQPTIRSLTGNSSAVLLGDFLFTRAYACAASCRSGFPARQIARASTALCEGELRQQASVENWNLSLREYRSILEQKTGRLCSVSCRLGAWAVGAPREYVQALAQFGRYLGLAFQIYDDWLDYWGTEAVGKTLGTDLDQRKPTLPLLRLLKTTSESNRQDLTRLLEDRAHGLVGRLHQEFARCDAEEFTLASARRCARQAVAALHVLPESPAKSCLQKVAEFSVARSA